MVQYEAKSAKVLTKLGAIIALERRNLGYSQVQLADRALIHRTYLSNIERGEQNISLQTLIRIAQSLNLSPSQLLEFAEFGDD